jgi:transposase-like protein
MQCPKCGSDRTTKCDRLPSGSQRFECMDCDKKWVPEPKKAGKPRKLNG